MALIDKFGLQCYSELMIAEKDRTVISRIAREYGVQKVLLFGSGADPEREAADIDLGALGSRSRLGADPRDA